MFGDGRFTYLNRMACCIRACGVEFLSEQTDQAVCAEVLYAQLAGTCRASTSRLA
jgi:hypothetical protein